MSSVVCTLFDGGYWVGAGALINSLARSGYKGVVYCGTRGELPPWAKTATQGQSGLYTIKLSEEIEVHFKVLASDLNLTNLKPTFMLDVLSMSGCDKVFYFDSDLVVKCPWERVEGWCRGGVALCEDLRPYLPARHPHRLDWVEFAQKHNLPLPRQDIERYFNAGFMGIAATNADFLRLWQSVIELTAADLKAEVIRKNQIGHLLFPFPDQDACNLALMASLIPINAIGPEGMDFAPSGEYLSHNIGPSKAWMGGFWKNALKGHPPQRAQKEFFNYSQGPLVTVLSAGRYKRLKMELAMASILGRFYKRS